MGAKRCFITRNLPPQFKKELIISGTDPGGWTAGLFHKSAMLKGTEQTVACPIGDGGAGDVVEGGGVGSVEPAAVGVLDGFYEGVSFFSDALI